MDFLNEVPQDLQIKIQNVINTSPQSLPVFHELVHFFTDGNKKRKLANGAGSITPKSDVNLDNATVIQNLSISIPERRRSNVIIHDNKISLAKELEPLKIDHSFEVDTITACLCLYVPDKAKPQYNLIVFTHNGSEPSLQITLPDDKTEQSLRLPSPYEKFKEYSLPDFFTEIITKSLGVQNFQTSQDKMVTTAYRGNKEGHFFLLDKCLFFGFKKPVLLFPHEYIDTVTYTNITRLTFNLTIKLITPLPGNPTLEYEFSMIDQEDYDEINEYMAHKKFGNASLDESLKAKNTTNEFSNELELATGGGSGGGNGNDATVAALGSLENQQEGDDDEEDDEDYAAPNSGDEVDDSGSGSESDSDSDSE